MTTTLYSHQQKIIADDPQKTGLFLGTGSGKTRIALLLARGNTLVICPKTQRDDQNWQREATKLGLNIDLKVMSKETFRRDHASMPRFDTVIVDEAETCLGATPNIRYRNKKQIPKCSQLFEALQSFVELNKPERLYLCTATITRSPMTVWAAGVLLGRNWTHSTWRDAFYIRLNMPGREVWVPKKDSDTKDRLAKAVQGLGYTGRLSDYFDVPTQSYKVISLELLPEQKKRLKELRFEFPDPIVLIGKRHQVENGVLSGNEFSKFESFNNQKIDKILELAEEFPKMIVFARYTAQIHQIINHLSKAGKNVLSMTGTTSNRGELLKKANEAQECIFVVQSQISAGWELPDFPVMVFASMSYSVVDRIQGEGRILRANALKKNLYIDLVMRGGVDEAVYKCIQNKQDFHERVYCGLDKTPIIRD